jgi:hypothetical protein
MTDKSPHQRTVPPDRADSSDDRDLDGLSGPVRESPRSPDETDSSERADASNPRAREERNAPSASGLPADDADTGEARKKLYKDGATLVSKID